MAPRAAFGSIIEDKSVKSDKIRTGAISFSKPFCLVSLIIWLTFIAIN